MSVWIDTRRTSQQRIFQWQWDTPNDDFFNSGVITTCESLLRSRQKAPRSDSLTIASSISIVKLQPDYSSFAIAICAIDNITWKHFSNVIYGACLFSIVILLFLLRSLVWLLWIDWLMASTRGPRVENQPSKLLNEAENQKLFDLLGHRCVVRTF